MNRRNMFLIVGLCFLAVVLPLKAQRDTYLSVDDALLMAVQNNKNIRMAELEHRMANADFHQTDALVAFSGQIIEDLIIHRNTAHAE